MKVVFRNCDGNLVIAEVAYVRIQRDQLTGEFIVCGWLPRDERIEIMRTTSKEDAERAVWDIYYERPLASRETKYENSPL